MSLEWNQVPEGLRRKLLFTPSDSQKALSDWISFFLGIDMPDTVVDPDSNSSPMGLIWEIYEQALSNKDPDFSQVLGYAARECFKTLTSAVMEVLCTFHLHRATVHLAAVEQQSQKAQSYVRDFFNRPMLRDFIGLDNVRNKEIVRYEDEYGNILTPKEFAKLPPSVRTKYIEIKTPITVVVATLQSVNGQHGSFVVNDELDVMANPKVYEEAKLIPTVEGTKMPITLLVSTRKFSYGLVQKEIDNAESTGLRVRHWNIIDATEPCSTDRHLPDRPKIPVYVNHEDLLVHRESELASMSEDEKARLEKMDAYEGCLTRCKIFAQCRGHLATRQAPIKIGRKKYSMLKPVQHTQNTISKTSVEMVLAQLLCRKPTQAGMIYPYLNAQLHVRTAAQMVEMLTGEPAPNVTKEDLIRLLKTRECRFVAGMDFGYTHNFAVSLAAVDGNRAFVIDGIEQAELELEQQIEMCDRRLKHYNAKIYADPENPQNIKTFKRKGYKIEPVDKGHGSVLGGIEIVRGMIRSGTNAVRLYFLAEDPVAMQIFKKLAKYHWKSNAAGEPSDVPDDRDDDLCDSTRYLLMSVFGKSGGLVVAKDGEPPPKLAGAITPDTPLSQKTWARQIIDQAIGSAGPSSGAIRSGRRGGIVWSFGDDEG